MTTEQPALKLGQMLDAEWQAVSVRRSRYQAEDWFQEPTRRFGVALSGGGIRSATIGLGFLEILNRFGILERADYLSTVSGGGYLGGYVQAKLWRGRSSPDPCGQLFGPEDQQHLRQYGDYLAPGTGVRAGLHRVRMAGAVVASILLNFVWLVALLLSVERLIFLLFGGFVRPVWAVVTIATIGVLAWHLFLHGLRHVGLWASDLLNTLEGILLVAAAACAAVWLSAYAHVPLWGALAALVVTGFFANPNLLTIHRFYRDRLQTAYLMRQQGDRGKPIMLHELLANAGPYPLINTCLNVLNEADPAFAGAAASDYFLLSPLFCGSKLTGYAPTTTRRFRTTTLATAVACSGAAVNPGMGTKTNRVLAFVMALLNLRLGYWMDNPRADAAARLHRYPWWPYYLLLELFGKTDTRRALVNVSDGGFIDNLGIYELLRRRCDLIIALDASADPKFEFSDLNNLVVRARNELGLVITFRQDPEQMIRPSVSNGFSRSQFVVADITELPGKSQDQPYQGLLVYAKSSLCAQKSWLNVSSQSFDYKTYHPAFPHESTADQFFDEAQWRAYYQLGRFIAGDLLKVDARPPDAGGAKGIADLYRELDALRDDTALAQHLI